WVSVNASWKKRRSNCRPYTASGRSTIDTSTNVSSPGRVVLPVTATRISADGVGVTVAVGVALPLGVAVPVGVPGPVSVICAVGVRVGVADDVGVPLRVEVAGGGVIDGLAVGVGPGGSRTWRTARIVPSGDGTSAATNIIVPSRLRA